MVTLNEIRASNSRITADVAPRVIVSVGGTTGIGKGTLFQLVSLGLPMKVYVVGRNGAGQKLFIDQLRQSNPQAEVIWLEGQISLMAETSRLCSEIKAREQKIDLLLLSAGFLPMGQCQETSEGIEKASAVGYYSRMLFLSQLLPLLSAAAADPSTTYVPRVINVLAAGLETSGIFLDDLALKGPGHFGLVNYMKHAPTMTTLTMRKLAEDPANRGVVLIHHFPGSVGTDLLRNGDTRTAAGWTTGSAIRYGGKGVPQSDGQGGALTLNRTLDGSLFCVNQNLEPIWLDKVLGELQGMKAPEAVWRWTENVLKSYQ